MITQILNKVQNLNEKKTIRFTDRYSWLNLLLPRFYDHYPVHGAQQGGQQGDYYTGWDLTSPFKGLSEKDIAILHSKGERRYEILFGCHGKIME